MKKISIPGLVAAFGLSVLISCNDTSKTSNANDSSGTAVNDNPSANISNSGDYSAYANDLEKNSEKGRYVNPKTGKTYKKLSVNRTTGEITDENNEPVWRYVDTQDWWVYGLDDSDWAWEQMSEAKMDNDVLMYKDENGNWVSYDKRWKLEDENMGKTYKTKIGNTKIKFGKDGDIKVKDENGTTKYDADDDKVKTDSSHK